MTNSVTCQQPKRHIFKILSQIEKFFHNFKNIIVLLPTTSIQGPVNFGATTLSIMTLSIIEQHILDTNA
jgi:hypothetical protein